MSKVAAALAGLLLSPALAFASGAGAATGSTTDPISQAIVGAIIVGVFTLLAVDRVHRVLIVMGAVGLLWTITYFTPFRLITFDGVAQAVDVNVLFLLASMMALVGVLKTTGVFEWAVAKMMNRSGGDPYHVLYSMVWFTGILSAFCDNVTTVIFVTPMAYQMARTMRLRPLALLLPIVMASNIGGTATLIGDPPNIMIGSGAGLTFVDFIMNVSAPVVVMMFVLPWFSARFFRQDYEQVTTAGPAASLMPVPTIADPVLLKWALWISGMVFVGFFTHGFTGMPTAVPATIGAGALLIVQDILYLRSHKPTHEERQHGLIRVIEKEIEWATLTFFGFLFIAVGAAVQTGLIATMGRGLTQVVQGGGAFLGLGGLGTLLFAALLICWVSGFLSSIIDNIPFVAVMIPVIHILNGQMPGDPSVLWWALSLGACLGGNGTPVGASANVTVIGIAERAGARLAFRDFVRFGAPTAAITLGISSVFLATHVFLGARGAMFAWSAFAVALVMARGIRWIAQRTPARAAVVR